MSLVAFALPVGAGPVHVWSAQPRRGRRTLCFVSEGVHIVYSNGRPAILASTLPYAASVAENETKSVVCPDCGTFRVVSRRLIKQHFAPDGLADCPGSFQEIEFDVTPELDRVLDARRHAAQVADGPKAGLRRSARIQFKPTAPIAPPLAHLGKRRAPNRAQVAGWSAEDAAPWDHVNR
jgi:hypothetical protein